MNAALASGEAGVGEMNPARSPMRPRQFGVALAAAVVGGGLGMFTYHAVSGTSPAFTGQVTPAQTYYLNFSAANSVLSLGVTPGTHVTKGEVLATQDSSVAAANLASAQAMVTADTAVVAADEAPTASGSQAADNQLSIQQANNAVTAAQNALSLEQNNSQHTVSAESTAVQNAQNTYNQDSARYNSECANLPGSTSNSANNGVPATNSPSPTSVANGVGASGSPIANPSTSASPSTSAGTSTSASPRTSVSGASSTGNGALAPLPQASASSSQAPQQAPAAQPNTGATPTSTGNTQQEQFCQNLQSTVSHDFSSLSAAQAELANIQSSTQLSDQHDLSSLTQSQALLTAAQQRQAAAGAPLTPAVIAQAKASLATAEAQVATDQVALANTKIVAPQSGIIADTGGAVGDMAGPDGVHGFGGPAEQSGTQSQQQPGFELFVPQSGNGGSAAQNQSSFVPLITLYTGPLDVVAQIPETSMSSVQIGGTATLDVTALNLTVQGTVKSEQLDPVRSPSNTTYYDVTIAMNSNDPRIMTGMSTQVSLG